MPGMNGSELAARIRQDRPHLRVLYASGYADDAIAHYGVSQVDAALLRKPFDVESLAHKVRAVLDGTP